MSTKIFYLTKSCLPFSREVKYNGDVRYWGVPSLSDISKLL
jgi:hypothetical protein